MLRQLVSFSADVDVDDDVVVLRVGVRVGQVDLGLGLVVGRGEATVCRAKAKLIISILMNKQTIIKCTNNHGSESHMSFSTPVTLCITTPVSWFFSSSPSIEHMVEPAPPAAYIRRPGRMRRNYYCWIGKDDWRYRMGRRKMGKLSR